MHACTHIYLQVIKHLYVHTTQVYYYYNLSGPSNFGQHLVKRDTMLFMVFDNYHAIIIKKHIYTL